MEKKTLTAKEWDELVMQQSILRGCADEYSSWDVIGKWAEEIVEKEYGPRPKQSK